MCRFIVGWRNINDCNLASPSSCAMPDSVDCVASISKSMAGGSASGKKIKILFVRKTTMF